MCFDHIFLVISLLYSGFDCGVSQTLARVGDGDSAASFQIVASGEGLALGLVEMNISKQAEPASLIMEKRGAALQNPRERDESYQHRCVLKVLTARLPQTALSESVCEMNAERMISLLLTLRREGHRGGKRKGSFLLFQAF